MHRVRGIGFLHRTFHEKRFREFELKKVTGKAIWNDCAIRFKFPSIKNPGALDFKQDAVLEARKRHDQVIYIGDGSSDYNAARSSDHIYAVRESRLARCAQGSLCLTVLFPVSRN